MALFGGSTSVSTAQDASNNVAAGAQGVAVPGDRNVVNVTAGEAFTLAEKALLVGERSLEGARNLANSVTQQVAADAKTALDALAMSRQSTIPFPIIAAGVVLGLFFMWSKAK